VTTQPAETPAEKRPSLARRIVWRIFLFALAAFGLYAVWPRLLQVLSAWPNLKTLEPLWFLLMLPLEVASFLSVWVLIRLALGVRSYFLVGTAQLSSNAVSMVMPGGAAAGGTLMYSMLTQGGVDPARVAGALTAVSLLTFGTLFALPLLSVPAILSGVSVNRGLMQTAVAAVGLFLIAALASAVVLTTDRPLAFVAKAVQSVRNRVRRRKAPLEGLPDRLLGERDFIREVLGAHLRRASLGALGKVFFDFGALLAALAAVGTRPRASLVLLAYVVASFLGMIPITPGGLGFVGTLHLAGVSTGDATLATLAYRLISYWLPMPAGLIALLLFRRRYGRGRPGPAAEEAAARTAGSRPLGP
jgi:uncharacterized membrane protein YbhN (UPF0104 family)